MSSNQSLLAKADLALSDLTNDGGALQPEQANTFIRKLIVQPTLIRAARVVTMGASQRKINKIGFGSRILRPGLEATALSSGDRVKPTTEQVLLNTDEVIAEVRIPYGVMEDNVETAGAAGNEASNTGPGGLRNTIITLIAERAALDLEELALLGDLSSGDAYLKLTDGWIKEAETNGNVVDTAGATLSKTVFKNGVKTMPDQYLRNRAALKHYVSVDQETEYRDTIADRGTPLGDAILQGTNPVFAFGSSIEAVALMPEGKGLFTNPLNLIMGIQRDISLEYDKDITARVYIIVLTARVAFQVEESEAIVVYNNIATP